MMFYILYIVLPFRHRRIQGAKGVMHPKFLAFYIILCFERQCAKQNTVVRLKSKDLPTKNFWAGYATACRYIHSAFYPTRVTVSCLATSR